MRKGASSYSRDTNTSSSSQQHYTTGSTDVGCLVMLVIAVTLFLSTSALCMGYGGIIGDLLGLGVLAFVIACFSTR